jgi:hypothetical protein
MKPVPSFSPLVMNKVLIYSFFMLFWFPISKNQNFSYGFCFIRRNFEFFSFGVFSFWYALFWD